MARYGIKQGDCISSIAYRYGFFPDTIWRHSGNAELRGQRSDPNLLYPGDVLEIPDMEPRHENASTDSRHRFVRRGVPAMLRLQLFDGAKPRENQSYDLTIDGVHSSSTTDSEGKIEHPIPPDAREAEIVIGPDEERYHLDLGNLDPVTELSGVQSRLNNLGYDSGPVDGEYGEQTKRALLWFQGFSDLDQTGEPDDATIAKLEELHDSVGALPGGESEEEESDSDTDSDPDAITEPDEDVENDMREPPEPDDDDVEEET